MKNLQGQEIFVEEMKRFEDYLKKSGLKVSYGREEVFREVFDFHGHFTAEDLVKSCKKNRSKASRATIYRSLHELLEAGIIRKTAFGEKHEFYEHLYDEPPHHHARCVRCRGIIEFPDLKEDKVYVAFLQKRGFKILGHEMHFYGVCQSCLMKR